MPERKASASEANIPAGVKDGARIRLAGKGEEGPGGPGDLYVITRVAPSPIFRRLGGGNLEVTVPITIPEALRGATIEVPTLEGTKKIKVARRNQTRDRPATERRGGAEAEGRQRATSATGWRSRSPRD